jgi:hypothetical protein
LTRHKLWVLVHACYDKRLILSLLEAKLGCYCLFKGRFGFISEEESSVYVGVIDIAALKN